MELIKNGVQARFRLITGLTLDDSDRLFVSDSELRHVLVFDKQHKVEASIGHGIVVPAGLAVDNENRFLYVCDTGAGPGAGIRRRPAVQVPARDRHSAAASTT